MDVPAASPQGKKFEQFIVATEKIARSVGAAATEALARAATASPLPTKEIRGTIVPLGRGSAGKDRFAFDNEGVLYPLPLSDQETAAVKKLLRSGKLQSVSVQTEQTTQVFLRSVQVKDGAEVIDKPFAEFLKQPPRLKRDRVPPKEATPANPDQQPNATVLPSEPAAAIITPTRKPIWSQVTPSKMGLTDQAVETLTEVLNAAETTKDLFGERFSPEENTVKGARVALVGPTAVRVSFTYSYLDYHEAGEDHLEPTPAEKTFDHTIELSPDGNWRADTPHADMELPKRTICASLEALVAKKFGPAPGIENLPKVDIDPAPTNPEAMPIPPERQSEEPGAINGDAERASDALARVSIPTLDELERAAPEHA